MTNEATIILQVCITYLCRMSYINNRQISHHDVSRCSLNLMFLRFAGITEQIKYLLIVNFKEAGFDGVLPAKKLQSLKLYIKFQNKKII